MTAHEVAVTDGSSGERIPPFEVRSSQLRHVAFDPVCGIDGPIQWLLVATEEEVRHLCCSHCLHFPNTQSNRHNRCNRCCALLLGHYRVIGIRYGLTGLGTCRYCHLVDPHSHWGIESGFPAKLVSRKPKLREQTSSSSAVSVRPSESNPRELYPLTKKAARSRPNS